MSLFTSNLPETTAPAATAQKFPHKSRALGHMTNPVLLDRHLKIQNSCKVHTQVQNNTDTHVEFKLMQLNFMHRINNKNLKCSPSLTAWAATVCFSSEFNRNWAVWHHWNRVHKKDNLCKNACKTHSGPLQKKKLAGNTPHWKKIYRVHNVPEQHVQRGLRRTNNDLRKNSCTLHPSDEY